jgi:hypothetical protein
MVTIWIYFPLQKYFGVFGQKQKNQKKINILQVFLVFSFQFEKF